MALATLKEIKELLEKITDKHDPYWERLKEDKRVGVQKLITSWEKQKEKEVQLHNRFIELCIYETEIREQGYTYIAGIDEVGRGPLAGPVVTAAVILPESFYLPGIDDSKKLSEAKREQYYEIIQKQAISIGVGIIEPAEIDRINIYEATKKGMLAAVQNLDQQPDFLLIDAMKLNVPYPSKSIIKGDSKSVSIAAASIIAKVTRDEMMKNLDKEFPAYCFASNMGYGTKDHLLALETEGYTIHHRKSFSPIKEMTTRNRGI